MDVISCARCMSAEVYLLSSVQLQLGDEMVMNEYMMAQPSFWLLRDLSPQHPVPDISLSSRRA